MNKCGIKAFPITHINRYRNCEFVDLNNEIGLGHNHVYSITGVDKTHVLSYGVELKTYLELYKNCLEYQKFNVHNGEITPFMTNPRESDGSVTITNGIKVEA